MSGREQAETGFPQRFSSAGSLLGDKTRGGGEEELLSKELRRWGRAGSKDGPPLRIKSKTESNGTIARM